MIYLYKGNYYFKLGLARMHDNSEEFVAYIPLRVEPEWAGTARIALRPLREFETKFMPVGDRLPSYVGGTQ